MVLLGNCSAANQNGGNSGDQTETRKKQGEELQAGCEVETRNVFKFIIISHNLIVQ